LSADHKTKEKRYIREDVVKAYVSEIRDGSNTCRVERCGKCIGLAETSNNDGIICGEVTTAFELSKEKEGRISPKSRQKYCKICLHSPG
jgi:hypothetical protein